MNTDSRYQLVDRYLDGASDVKDGALLTKSIESDPDVLAFLCESAEMEAGLQKQLATPGPRPASILRITPFWHWRRAGKWLTTGAAAAALLTIAAVVFWPRSGVGGNIAQRSSSLSVKRFALGERQAAPLQTPGVQANSSPLEQAEFQPGEKWLRELRTILIDDGYDADKLKKGDPVTADEYLMRYLKAAGVTFPEGASVQWVADNSTNQGLPLNTFVAVNTAANLAWIAAIGQDPAARGPRLVRLYATVWKFTGANAVPSRFPEPPGSEFFEGEDLNGKPLPALLATERILTAQDQQLPRPKSSRHYISGAYGQGPFRFGFGGTVRNGPFVNEEIAAAFCRAGDHILISGLAGSPALEKGKIRRLEDSADMEFNLTLADGEEAVIQLGCLPDGADWIMSIRAHLDPLPQQITLGQIPSVMQFDPAVLTVKAGLPVCLFYKNEECPLMHNFVLVKPGKVEAVGALADRMLSDPEALAKRYIPQSPDIIASSQSLIGLRQSEIIEFTAPAEPGDYPYLCTFPGHWRLQRGILRVVK